MNINVLWIKNTDGRPDAVLTFAVIGFTILVVKILFAGLHLVWGSHLDLLVQAPDALTIGAVLVPTLGAYVSNKYVTLTQHPFYVNQRQGGDAPPQA